MRGVIVAVLTLASASAEARQCYRRVVEPPRYATVSEEVMVAPEREVADYTPAETRQVEETVVVSPEWRARRVIPAQYAEEEATVEAAPEHREWRTRDEDGDVIGCWVNVPARYVRATRRVMVAPPREVEEVVPERTATRLRTEVVEPAHTSLRTIPARYATRERETLVSSGGARWAPIANDCDR